MGAPEQEALRVAARYSVQGGRDEEQLIVQMGGSQQSTPLVPLHLGFWGSNVTLLVQFSCTRMRVRPRHPPTSRLDR
jgi:hypothetical protein